MRELGRWIALGRAVLMAGVACTTEEEAAGPQTHPVREMTFGWADPSVDCPAD